MARNGAATKEMVMGWRSNLMRTRYWSSNANCVASHDRNLRMCWVFLFVLVHAVRMWDQYSTRFVTCNAAAD